MRRVLPVLAVAVVWWISVVPGTAQQVYDARATLHCGSFKFGTDGSQPGPSGITAKNTSCWFARAVALLGPAPGWHCHLVTGLLVSCRHGDQTVGYFGE